MEQAYEAGEAGRQQRAESGASHPSAGRPLLGHLVWISSVTLTARALLCSVG